MPNKLELTFVGKNDEVNIEPRILIENKELSNVESDNNTENMIIHGDNLLALKALESKYAGKVKCIYIDPPYNTGSAFEHYYDNLEHSIWLKLMKMRLEILRRLLKDEGTIFIQIDDEEQAYLKVLCDEVFGRKNFINMISVNMKNIAGASGGGEDKRLKKNCEYILIYSKDYEKFNSFKKINSYTEISKLLKYYEENDISWKYTSVIVNKGKKEYVCSTKDGTGEQIKIYRRADTEFKSVNKIAQEENLQIKEVYKKYFNSIFVTAMPQSSIRPRVLNALVSNGDILSKDSVYSIEYIPITGKNKGKVYEQFYKGEKLRLFAWFKDVAVIRDNNVYKIDEKGTFINMKGEFKADKKLGDGGDTLNIHVKAPYEVKLGYKFFLDVDREYFVVPVLNKFDAGVDGKFMIKPEVLIGYDKKLKFVDQKITLYTFDAYSFSFNICGVEFWVDVCPNIYMKFNANVSGAFYGGFQYHYERTFQAGVTYHNKWNAYGDTKLVADKLTFITPRTKFEAEASCGLFLGADLVVDKVAGPSIAVGPKVSANAKLEYAPFDTKQPITFNASLKAGVYAEMGAKLKLWKFDIAEWKSKPINLVPEKEFWSYQYPKSAEENNSDNDQVNKQMNELQQEWEKQNPELARKNAALSELQKAIDNWKKVKPTVSNYDLGSINIVKGTIVNSIYNYKDLEGYKNQDANMFNLITEMVAYEQILKNNGKLPPLDDVLGGIRKWYKSIQ